MDVVGSSLAGSKVKGQRRSTICRVGERWWGTASYLPLPRPSSQSIMATRLEKRDSYITLELFQSPIESCVYLGRARLNSLSFRTLSFFAVKADCLP